MSDTSFSVIDATLEPANVPAHPSFDFPERKLAPETEKNGAKLDPG